MKSAGVRSLFLLFPFTLASFIVDTLPANTPALTCEPVLLQWQGGLGEYYSIHPGSKSINLILFSEYFLAQRVISVDGTLSENFGTSDQPSFHWTVDFEAGTVVKAQVTDSTGATEKSEPFTIQPGSNGCTLKTTGQVNIVAPTDSKVSRPQVTRAPLQTQTTISSSSSSTSSDDTPRTTTKINKNGATTSSSGSGTTSTNLISTSSTFTSIPITTPLSASAVNSTASDTIPLSLASSPAGSSSSSASSVSHKSKPRVGLVFAILVPCLVLLGILAIILARWRRRRRDALSILEAHPSPAHWFDRPAYRGGKAESEWSSYINTAPAASAAAGSVLTVRGISPSGHSTSASGTESEISKPSHVGADTADPKILQTRIAELIFTNARLADLARVPSVGVAPPAYAISEG
ncbi:hypothetical protein B0H19DRAFT_1248544 [Mycena capillaripes]|nr:hypothetical protein B0H19DRAFT_1248544 [Mycena capillaripes]